MMELGSAPHYPQHLTRERPAVVPGRAPDDGSSPFTLPRRPHAGVGRAAGGAVGHDFLVAGVGEVLAAGVDREGLVDLVLGIEVEATVRGQLVDLSRGIEAFADVDD